MSEGSRKAKSQLSRIPWWGWVIIAFGGLMVLPSLFSNDPLSLQETYGPVWEDLQSIGENLWSFAGEALRLMGIVRD